jgi:hypothetical protein
MPTKRPAPKRTLTDRMDRVEAVLEETQLTIREMAVEHRNEMAVIREEQRTGMAAMREHTQKAFEENERFHLSVRGAIQHLLEASAENERATASLKKEWEAYLRTIHPRH